MQSQRRKTQRLPKRSSPPHPTQMCVRPRGSGPKSPQPSVPQSGDLADPHSQAVKLCFPALFHKVPGESVPIRPGFVEPPAEPTDDAESLFCCSGLFSSLQLERGLPQHWGLSCRLCFIPSAWQILGALWASAK